MNRERQEWFYRDHYTNERYARLKQHLETVLRTRIEFRIMEAPVFCSSELRRLIADASIELVKQCTAQKYLDHAMEAAIPSEYRMPHVPSHPTCAVVDFAITIEDGTITPKLVELQGFPSLFAYQLYLAEAYHIAYELREDFSPFFDASLTFDEYRSTITRWLLGVHNPDNTALVDYHPHQQKTYPDFAATYLLTGMAATDILDLTYVDGMLFHKRGGGLQPLRRIYMRAIPDELEQYGVQLPFAWNTALDVEWVVHPNWYFLMSKYSLPFLEHPSVPRAMFCNQLERIPPIGQFVLKPLFAFAGKGVNLTPSDEDLNDILETERSKWLLMEKIDYAPVLSTPLGDNFIEIRCMVLWEEGMQPRPTMSLVRTGRAAMMGSRYLTEPCTGASICFFEQ